MPCEPDIFIVPVLDKFLIHAPLHNFATLVDREAARQIRAGLLSKEAAVSESVRPMVAYLRSPGAPAPTARTGPVDNPFFLGLIPTRGCNMGCPYCDFAAPKTTSAVMDLELARQAVNVYMTLLVENGRNHAEVHFFGGEPFYAEEVIHFVVGYATMRAAELGLTVRFEATTNGLYNVGRCQWIADYFDTVVLSLDGPADIQNRNRPAVNGRGVFDTIARNAKILSEGSIEFIVRTCITNDTIPRMPEMARWVSRDFRPSSVCFETLTYSPLAETAGFELPDPWEFARNFDLAARILEEYDIETVISTADIRTLQATFCPVGRDALIVSSDGAIDACYLLKKDWSRNGLNMRFGRINLSGRPQPRSNGCILSAADMPLIDLQPASKEISPWPALEIDHEAVQRVRSLNVHNRPLCTHCLSRYHCAGGCHVNHDTSAPPGRFDDLCIQTRLITIANLLKEMNQPDLVDEWFADRPALEASVWQSTDRLCSQEIML